MAKRLATLFAHGRLAALLAPLSLAVLSLTPAQSSSTELRSGPADWMTAVPLQQSSAGIRPADGAEVEQTPPDFSWPALGPGASYRFVLRYPDGSEQSRTGGAHWLNWHEALPPVEAEVQACEHACGGVVLHDPSIDRVQPEVSEREREEPRGRERRVAAVAERLLAGGSPESAGAKRAIDVVEPHDADRLIVVGRVDPQEVRVALRHHLEQRRRHDLLAAAEVEPSIVLFARQPSRG